MSAAHDQLVQRLLHPGETVGGSSRAKIDTFFGKPLPALVYVGSERLFVVVDDDIADGTPWFSWWSQFKEAPKAEKGLLKSTISVYGSDRGPLELQLPGKTASQIAQTWEQRHTSPPPVTHVPGSPLATLGQGGFLACAQCSGCGQTKSHVDVCFACGRHLDWPAPLDKLASISGESGEALFWAGPPIRDNFGQSHEAACQVTRHAFAAAAQGNTAFPNAVAEWCDAMHQQRAMSADVDTTFPDVVAYYGVNDVHRDWITLQAYTTANGTAGT